MLAIVYEIIEIVASILINKGLKNRLERPPSIVGYKKEKLQEDLKNYVSEISFSDRLVQSFNDNKNKFPNGQYVVADFQIPFYISDVNNNKFKLQKSLIDFQLDSIKILVRKGFIPLIILDDIYIKNKVKYRKKRKCNGRILQEQGKKVLQIQG